MLVERIGYPALLGEILAGIVFGPAVFGLLRLTEVLDIFAELAVFLLMIYVGIEVDLHDLFRLGPQALIVAFGGFIVPFGLGYLVGNIRTISTRWYRDGHHLVGHEITYLG